MTATGTSPAAGPPPGGASAPGRAALAWTLTLAYTLIIVYASLQPFGEWRRPSHEILHFLTAPWPRYITLDDVLINVGAYLPLGFLLALALSTRLKAPLAVLAAAALATTLSLTMETAQAFLTTRIASKLDVLTNGTGGLIGAMAAPLLSPVGFPGRRLAAWRERVFNPDAVTDSGLVIVCLWLATHLDPTAQLFGTGDLRETIALPARLAHTPHLLMSAEAAIVFFNLLAVGLLVAASMREPQRAFPIAATVVTMGLAIKAVAVIALFDAPRPLNWLTPGVGLGLAAGAAALYPFARLPRAACTIVALASLAAAVAAINLAPANPYQTVPPKLIASGASQLLRFSTIARGLSELWPFLAMAYLVAAAIARRRAS